MLEQSTFGVHLTSRDPWLQRLKAWADERFPLGQVALFVVLYATICLYSGALEATGEIVLSPRLLVGFLAFWSFFLLLRVLDEHKDFAEDRHNYPERVLQRGLIDLDDLKIVGVGCIALQASISVMLDGGLGPVTLWWLGVMLWTSLMTVEFFIGDWLRAHLLPYAISHMFVMPLALLWVFAMARSGPVDPFARSTLWIVSLGFFFGFLFEVARKTKAPEEEEETIDSYSKILGTRGSAALLALLLALSALSMAGLLYEATGRFAFWWGVGLLVLTGLGGVEALRFGRRASPERAKALQTMVILAGLSIFLAGNALLIVERGLAWSS